MVRTKCTDIGSISAFGRTTFGTGDCNNVRFFEVWLMHIFYSLNRRLTLRSIDFGQPVRNFNFLVGREGFEPSTNGLKVRCSTD